MPDWSYRTMLRPLMLSLGAERSRRLATRTLGILSRIPFGLAAIDFLGHMRPDERLRRKVSEIDLATPIALGALIDPAAHALPAFSRFGAGLIEVGPVDLESNRVAPRWDVDIDAKLVAPIDNELTVSVEEVARNLEAANHSVPVCLRIAARDANVVRSIVERLASRVAMFSVDAGDEASVENVIRSAIGARPVLLRIRRGNHDLEALARVAMRAGAAGIWLHGEPAADDVRSLRNALGDGAMIVAGGAADPAAVNELLDAGADVAMVDAGLICSGPGLVKRCNEALLSLVAMSPHEPEPLTLDAARRSWFWGLLLGLSMFAGGLLALIIGSTRVVLPYDEAMSGMTRAQLAQLNPRLLPFMAHDRVSLAGTMISIGIFYSALAWFGIRRGAHWAQVTVIASSAVGFVSFFSFLGFGYFDPFHAFVTAILTQFMLLCLVMQPSPATAPQPEWKETPAWRRGQWGQLLFILLGAGLTVAGIVITVIGCTFVLVKTDLEFMSTTAAQLHLAYERLVPLVAHDRASLGGMLSANGVAIWLAAQWGFRAGARWLWLAFAWGGNIAFACTIAVHMIVGYSSPLHLAPAFGGWLLWDVALGLSRKWLSGRSRSEGL